MAQSAESVLKDLKGGKYAPLYFLQGDEPFYIDRITEYIEENALSPAEKSFNLTVLYGKDSTVAQVLDAARRFPMMAMRQVIVVKEAQNLPDLNRSNGREALLNYTKSPVPSTVLVFAHKHKKLDGKTALKKTLDKEAVLVESNKIYDSKLPAWIRQYCKEEHFIIKDKAVHLLAEHIGNDLNRIANELDKLMINFDKSTEITEAMISKHVGISKEYNVFELQSAIGKRDVSKANRIVNYFAMNMKNNPVIPIIATMFSYFSKILLVHQNRALVKDDLARLIGVNPYFIPEYLSAANNYSLAQTVKIIEYLHQADLQSKGIENAADESEILKELVFKMMY